MIFLILLIVAGVVLLNNAAWFVGAHTVGVVLVLLGAIPFAIFAVLAIVALLAGGAAASRHRRF